MVGSIILDSPCLCQDVGFYQMNVIFYDAMIMLPIVIVYLEELLDGNLLIAMFALGIDGLASVYIISMTSILSLCMLVTMYRQDC